MCVRGINVERSYMRVMGINVAFYFNDFAIRFWNCSDSVVFPSSFYCTHS